MSLPKTYAEIAKLIEVDFCGEAGQGHETGYYSMDGAPDGKTARVHWMERRVTRSGIRRFLLLAYDAEPISFVDNKQIPSWLQLWWRIQWVRKTASDVLHTTIPPSLWEEDKARLAAKLTNAMYPRFDVNDYKEYEAALRWARR